MKPSFYRAPIVNELQLDDIPPGQEHRVRLVMTENATGNETLVPVMVRRAADPGPIVGITAAVHGNELNGIPVIHRLFTTLAHAELLRGAVIAVPIVNVPGYLREQRTFEDGVDLNRIMPGKSPGTESQLYAHRIVERLVRGLDYLFDLHTASFGRVNSLYVRADMGNERTARLARVLTPQIILHSPGDDGTLRGAAQRLGVCALTVEVGDPQRLQSTLVRSTRLGLQEALEHLQMLPDVSDPDTTEVIECGRSFWMYTDRGGVLEVLPEVATRVRAGEVVAKLRNVWGDMVREYAASEDAVVVGKATNPAARAGSRIIHLGIERHPRGRPR